MLSFTLPLPLPRRIARDGAQAGPRPRPRPLGALALSALLALPAGSANAQPDGASSDTGAADPGTIAVHTAAHPQRGDARDTAPDSAASFAAAFAPLAAPLPALAPAAAPPPGAVDLASFEPPLEQPEATRSLGTGIASYYGRRFHGRRTANGERFDMNAMTAAHKTLPFGTRLRVTNPANGRSVTVRINDRGPFVPGRTIDLSRAAARELGFIARGHAPVELEVIER